MKKLGILSLFFALVSIFTIPTSVFAADAASLPDPGITPDSPFYFVDKWGKQISMVFTFKAESKVQKALRYAEERLAEMEAMAAQNKVQAMKQAADEYGNYLAIATQNMEKAMVKGVDTSEQVTAMMSKHIAIMYQQQYAYQQGNTAGEECQQIRQQICERAATCQEAAVQALLSKDPEAALRLNLSLMEQECNRIQNVVGQGFGTQIDDALQQYERLRAMNHQIIAKAEQLGLGSEVQQVVQQVTSNQEGVLAQICNQLQNNSGGSTDAPVQNYVQEQERLRFESGNIEQPTLTPTQ